MTGCQPFEHTDLEVAVIRKVLSGTRPDRPTVGFSDPLWALLSETWLEEYESLPPTRPDITAILEQLHDEAETWSPTGRLLAPLPMERKASCMSSVPPELTRRWLTRKSQQQVPPNPLRIWIKSWGVWVFPSLFS